MKQQTQDHLDVAERHRDVGSLLRGFELPDAWREWSVIAAFYSAVHNINAYLWETYGFAPISHRDRTLAAHTDAALVSVSRCYDLLRRWAYACRYDPLFRMSDAEVRRAFHCLEQIRSLVLAQIAQ